MRNLELEREIQRELIEECYARMNRNHEPWTEREAAREEYELLCAPEGEDEE
jgi:flagellar biosynthesis chaperone FliJ